MRSVLSALLASVVAVIGLGAGPALAQPTTQLGQWFCSVLNDSFDPEAAMKAFPLEKLGAAKQTRKTKDGRVNVEVQAVGDDYTVEYSYAYKVEDVDDRYGFDLTVDTHGSSGDEEEKAMLWLAEFGAPARDILGYHVGAGPLMSGDRSPFAFAVWDGGRIRAEWFYANDVRRAAGLCAKATKPSASVLAALDPTKGPALDRKTDKVSVWFCSVLKDNFDPVAAIKAFPLEQLPAAVETRDKDGEYVHVELKAEGDDYSVTYQYSFTQDDVDDRYGFSLAMDHMSFSSDSEDEAMAWLRGFGTPKKSMLGYDVGVSQIVAGTDEPAFKFSVWKSAGHRMAEWFEERDVRRAQSLCQ